MLTVVEEEYHVECTTSMRHPNCPIGSSQVILRPLIPILVYRSRQDDVSTFKAPLPNITLPNLDIPLLYIEGSQLTDRQELYLFLNYLLDPLKMSTTLFRSTAVRSALRAGASRKAAGIAGTSFVRGKATLPDLPC